MRITLAAAFVIIAATITVLLALGHDYEQRRRAEKFVLALKQIRVGQTDLAGAVKITEPFNSNSDVSPPGEQLRFVFYNEWLHRLDLPRMLSLEPRLP